MTSTLPSEGQEFQSWKPKGPTSMSECALVLPVLKTVCVSAIRGFEEINTILNNARGAPSGTENQEGLPGSPPDISADSTRDTTVSNKERELIEFVRKSLKIFGWVVRSNNADYDLILQQNFDVPVTQNNQSVAQYEIPLSHAQDGEDAVACLEKVISIQYGLRGSLDDLRRMNDSFGKRFRFEGANLMQTMFKLRAPLQNSERKILSKDLSETVQKLSRQSADAEYFKQLLDYAKTTRKEVPVWWCKEDLSGLFNLLALLIPILILGLVLFAPRVGNSTNLLVKGIFSAPKY